MRTTKRGKYIRKIKEHRRKKKESLGQNEILEKKEERNACVLKTLLKTASS